MSFDVLKSRTAIQEARRELRRRKLSFASPWWKRFACKIGISSIINVGDELKSWDVLKSVRFIEKNVPKHASILDIGAFASELPCILHSLQYSDLVGIDLDPKIKKMPYADSVRYEVTDFMQTPFESESFDVITAISVIEHGFDGQLLLKELSRLLRPRGYFVASFDYWPDKVDTSGISIFGMSWTVFSSQEVSAFVREAAEWGLFPNGEMDLSGSEKAISCANKDYTFAWLVLQKDPGRHGKEK
jgi:SAM-dependent methyltransferase